MIQLQKMFGKAASNSALDSNPAIESLQGEDKATQLRSLTIEEYRAVAGGPELQVGDGSGG
jgi:hypothetical protein